MLVKCYDSEFEIPDILIDKFVNDFSGLPGGAFREGVHQLRDSIYNVIDLFGDEPDILEEPEFLTDFIRALAMQQAMGKLGILYDA
jgi:hypothetical protein